jgi:hypothetical protein
LHQALELAEWHGEAALSLTLASHPEGFNHNGEHPVVGLVGATGGNTHADSVPSKTR